jgi:hypothetical protein
LQIFWGAGNENDVTVSKFFQAGNENELTATIFKLVGNGNDLTVTSGGNDAHLCNHHIFLLKQFCTLDGVVVNI